MDGSVYVHLSPFMDHNLEDIFFARMQNIVRVAHALKEITAVSSSPSHPPFRSGDSPVAIDAINLPSPCPLLRLFHEAGVSSETAFAASRIYQRRAEQLRQRIQESIIGMSNKETEFQPACTLGLPSTLLMKKVTSALTNLYVERLEEWKKESVQRIKQASNSPVKAALGSSRTFNNKYVPLLEHFFGENPFPTHADKMHLAKNSNMEYKQIHVWFQNRRNRTKKGGERLRKRPTYEGATTPLDKSYERMKGHMFDSRVPEPFQPTSSDEIAKINVQHDKKDVFAPSSPPHAFPSLYPPTCHYDPFPCKSGSLNFNKPKWRRVPDSKQPPPLSTSIDNLVEGFSRLNVRDETRSKAFQLQSNAATVAITVIPSRAPHPSLIVRKYFQPTITVQRQPSVRPHVCCSDVFQSFGSASKPVTLVPSSVPPNKNELPGKRKTVPLPRRFSDQTQNTRRDTTPSDCSSTSSSPPWMFSTDSESRSCSSSVSSFPSPSDVASIQELPLVRVSMSPTA